MKIAHIQKSSDFNDVVSRGKKTEGKLLSVYSLRSCEGEPLKVGIIISKKTEKSAVRRNYLRRLIYAFFTEKAPGIKERALIVVRVIKTPGENKRKVISKAIREELEKVAEKARLI